jgi:hypothetical protein
MVKVTLTTTDFKQLETIMYDVKPSRRLKLIKSSRAESRVNSLKSNVSGTVSVPIIRAMETITCS